MVCVYLVMIWDEAKLMKENNKKINCPGWVSSGRV